MATMINKELIEKLAELNALAQSGMSSQELTELLAKLGSTLREAVDVVDQMWALLAPPEEALPSDVTPVELPAAPPLEPVEEDIPPAPTRAIESGRLSG